MTKNAKAKRDARARQERTDESYATARLHTRESGVMPPSASHPWMCETCGLPIEDGAGVLNVANNDPKLGPVGSHPVDARRADSHRHIKVGAYHSGQCNPDKDGEAFSFEVARAPTLTAWCTWVVHLSERNWSTASNTATILMYWWANRGDDLHRYSR